MTTVEIKPKTRVNITLAVPVVVSPGGRVLYANNGAAWGSGWTSDYTAHGAGPATPILAAFGGVLSGNATGSTPVNPTPSLEILRTVTGFIIGRSYTLTARVANLNAVGSRVRLSVGPHSTSWVTGNSLAPVSVTFTAAATSLDLFFTVEDNPASSTTHSNVGLRADEILLVENDLTTDHLEVDADDATIKLDIATIPYAQADVRIPLLSDELVEQLNPADGTIRVLVTTEDEAAGTSREFDLVLRGRPVAYGDRSLILRLASDEALLMDWAPLAKVSTRDQEGNLAFLINDHVLIHLGTALFSDLLTADLTAYWELTNILPNPSAAITVGTFFTNAGNATGLSIDSAGSPPYGTTSILWSSSAAGWSSLSCRAHSVEPGHVYTASAYVRQIDNRNVRIRFIWRDADNEIIKVNLGTQVAASSFWSTRPSLTATAPRGAAKVGMIVEFNAAGSGEAARADGLMLYEGDELVEFFTGSITPSGYTTAWEDALNASPSTRTPIVERPPELFEWAPGVSAWEYLQPLLSAAELRLVCDEDRVWRLIPEDYAVAGTITLEGAENITEATDDVDLDSGLPPTGVVVAYRWPNSLGIEKVRYDTSGTEGRVVRREFNKPYPGPGAARYLLARYSLQGRRQTVRALLDLTATPTQDVHSELPGAIAQDGQISSVTFDMNAGLMAVETVNLTEAP